VAPVKFEVVHRFDAPAEVVWNALVDWSFHAEWIPMTRVELGPGNPAAVGATFTAWTGPGPLALKDSMRVTVLDWDSDAGSGRCEVDKLGPVLKGRAGFTVVSAGTGSELRWIEDVSVRFVPRPLASVVSRLGAVVFRRGMSRLARLLSSRPPISAG
jgi:hypothetical protein